MIRVLIAEDSAVTRDYLAALFGGVPPFQVVGMARDGAEAVELAERLKPDVILMDVHMPRLSGYEATRRIMERAPTRVVMVTASLSQDEMAMGFEALSAGALTLVEKPGGPDHPDHAEAVRQLLQTVRLMSEVKVVRRWRDRARPVPRLPPDVRVARRIRIIAIGASTGGPQVIVQILAALPAGFPVPILVVQHIAPGFTTGLAEWLGQHAALRVKVAEAGEPARPGTVYLAPDGWQMAVTGEGHLRLTREPAENGFRPSAGHLFHSVAESFGRSALGILLTGMGCDGAEGLRRLREAGGVTIVQDQESSVVFGMPAEALRLGAAEFVLAPGQIAEMIRLLAARTHG